MLADLSGVLAQLLTAAALTAGAVALVATRRPALALGVLLDLLVAAGLLRLVGDPSWQAIATAAVVVALRHLIGLGLRIGARSVSGSPAAGPSRRWPAGGVLVGRLVRPAWRR